MAEGEGCMGIKERKPLFWWSCQLVIPTVWIPGHKYVIGRITPKHTTVTIPVLLPGQSIDVDIAVTRSK